MKLKHILSMAVLAVGALFTSCSEDGYWDANKTEGTAQYSFSAEKNSYSFGSAEKPEVVNVVLHRGSTKGDVTIPVVATFSDEALSGASEVTFKDGESTANYAIALASDIAAGNYSATVALKDSTYFSPASVTKTTVSITIEYTWEAFATGVLIDGWMGVNNENVEIMKAAGAPVYRIIKPFWNASIEAWAEAELTDAEKAAVTTQVIEFSIDAEGLIYYERYIYADYDIEAGDMVYGYHPRDYSDAYDEAYSPMNAVASETQVQFVSIMYVPGLGGWGPQQFVLDITGSGKTF